MGKAASSEGVLLTVLRNETHVLQIVNAGKDNRRGGCFVELLKEERRDLFKLHAAIVLTFFQNGQDTQPGLLQRRNYIHVLAPIWYDNIVELLHYHESGFISNTVTAHCKNNAL